MERANPHISIFNMLKISVFHPKKVSSPILEECVMLLMGNCGHSSPSQVCRAPKTSETSIWTLINESSLGALCQDEGIQR